MVSIWHHYRATAKTPQNGARLTPFITCLTRKKWCQSGTINSRRYPLSMLTGNQRTQIDKIWNAFWTGGITNPLTVIEQITYRPGGPDAVHQTAR